MYDFFSFLLFYLYNIFFHFFVKIHQSLFLYRKSRVSRLPLRSDNPVVPAELWEIDVELLLAALALDRACALDRSPPDPLHGRRVRAHDQERTVRVLRSA